MTIQGVDIGNLFSWLTAQLAPKSKGVTFTAFIGADEIAISGDIRDIGLKDVETIWIPPQKQSATTAIDELALRLVQLKLKENNSWMVDLSSFEFKSLIDNLQATEDKRETFHSEAERRKHFFKIHNYFAAILDKFDKLPGLIILTAQTARLSGDLKAALHYLQLAQIQNEESKKNDEKQNDEKKKRQKALELSIADVKTALAARAPKNAKVEAGTTPRKRVSASNLDGSAQESLRKGFSALYGADANVGDDRNFSAIASLYARYAPHGSLLFLPWNRAFLIHLERRMRDLNNGPSLACWDWTEGKVPEIFSVETVAGNEPNPLFSGPLKNNSSRRTTRKPRKGGGLPSKRDIETALQISDWADFSSYVEDNLNNRTHGWVGGDMGAINTAAYDPLFYAHRCQIDYIWSKWQSIYPDATVGKDILDEPLQPFGMTVRDVLDTKALGYVYQ